MEATCDPSVSLSSSPRPCSPSCSWLPAPCWPQAQAPVSFTGPTNFAAGDGPVSVAVGDFNGDGDPDLAVANQFSSDVSVLLGGAGGSFAGPTNFATGFFPNSVAVGDFNGDQRPRPGGRQRLRRHRLGAARRRRRRLHRSDQLPRRRPPTWSRWATSTATGIPTWWSPTTSPATSRCCRRPGRQLQRSDHRRHRHRSRRRGGGRVQRRRRSRPGRRRLRHRSGARAAGQLRAPPSPARPRSPPASTPISVAVGDFNQDGDPDLAVADESGQVLVLLGGPGGGFTGSTAVVSGSQALAGLSSVAVGDFNRDGDPDLVVANRSGNQVSVLLGGPGGSFGSPTNFPAGTLPASVAVADFNGDGKPDLAATNPTTNNVAVLLNTHRHQPGPGRGRRRLHHRRGHRPDRGRPGRAGQRQRPRRRPADRRAGVGAEPRHPDPERQRLVHLHPGRQLQRHRHLHLPGQRRQRPTPTWRP